MSRIRSVHPGLWTDEDFVSLSIHARLVCIGLWNEADDYGLFEWKPLRLKMRLAPVDDIDMPCILSELVRNKQIVPLWRGDRQYGVIRNFRLFQRPQKPSAPLVPMDQELNSIVGLPIGDTPPPPVEEYSDSPTGIAPQMEDGKGLGIGDGGIAPEPEHIAVTRKLFQILGVDMDDMRWFGAMARVQMWLKRGWSAENLIYPAAAKLMASRGAQGPPNNIAYVEKVIETFANDLSRPLPDVKNVNGTRTAKPAKPSLNDRIAELDRLRVNPVGPVESFADAAGGIIIDQPPGGH